MLTVIRFLSEENDPEANARLFSALEAREPVSPRRAFGVVATIVDGGKWNDHALAIEEFVGKFREVITWGTGRGFRVFIDTAVYAEDVTSAAVVVMQQPAEWMRLLGDLGIRFEFSLYLLGRDDSGAPDA